MYNNKSIWQIFIILGVFSILHLFVFVFAKGIQLLSLDYLPENISSYWTYFPMILLLLVLIFKNNKWQWENFENDKIVKFFILVISGTILWEQFFLDYNYFHDRSLIIEKIILGISFILIFLNPSYVIVFLTQSLFIWQFHQIPLGGFHLTDIRPVFEILTMFISFCIVKKRIHTHSDIFFLLALSLHASNYFVPGIAKIEISPNIWEWTFLNELNNLFISSYVNGWLGFLNEETILWIAKLIDKTEIFAQFVTLLIHLGSFFLLFKKRITLILFLGFELLHFGIFLASGIFFWAWILINLGFIYLMKRLPEDSIAFLYAKKTIVVFCTLVVLSPLVYQPTPLGWWDSRVNTIYDFIVTTEDGNKFKLNKNDFGPYDLLFTQNRFYYASDEKVLNNTYGVIQRDGKALSRIVYTLFNKFIKPVYGQSTKEFPNDSYIVYDQLQKAKNLDEVKQIIHHYGKNYFDKQKKQKLENFIKKYVINLNTVDKKHAWYTKLGAPYHIYDLSEKRFQGKKNIVRIEVNKYNTWWNKDQGQIVRYGEKKIMDINVEEN